ncbi:hypothetical protein O4H49_18895 [Kiloniella laminariae]|uniref:Uncharacterized protein n=1 Tax=Kiloniella laminariae TaxID=454162 RepID=A0ABT4LNZ3_9PROT|nr:DUF6638 family protein [Kiloniella laminariae]MCZ4282860.1 hypothetical protein [Kiloniella laminariae]
MLRLVERGLMFGNLFEVSTPIMVERYNQALERLSGKRTALTSFHIDVSGYAPEIADELEDELYLNPHGCNRQFILLSTEQKRSPLINMNFSTSRSILKRFIIDNEAALFVLTSRDAVFGELMNSVYRITEPRHLFDIRKIRIDADTNDHRLIRAEELSKLVERFRKEPDSWWDDLLCAEMIELAKKTGDITRFPVKLEKTNYEQNNFHTTHFGGIYIFRDIKRPAAICCQEESTKLEFPIDSVLALADRKAVATFFKENDLVEPLIDASDLDAVDILQQRLDFILIDQLSAEGQPIGKLSRRELRSVALRQLKELPEEFNGLNDLLRWKEQGGRKPDITPDHPAYFYTLRARFHPDRDLVNMLLAEYMPHDILQLFICHKRAFYSAYSGWNDAKRNYSADFLAQEYITDKSGTRRELFGRDRPADPLARHEEKQKAQPWARADYTEKVDEIVRNAVSKEDKKKTYEKPRKKPTKGPWGGTL